jgi:hypothetical protein
MLHKCLSLVLEPIRSKMLCGLLATTRDGTALKVHMVLGTYITDVPEGKDVCCVKHGNRTPMPCAGCKVAAGRLVESLAGQVQWRDSNGMERIRQESLSLLRDGCSVLRQRGQEELAKFSLSPVAPFYRDWPFAGGREHRLLAASRYCGFESMHSLASGTLKTLLVAIGARLSNAPLVSATMTTRRGTSRPLSSIKTTALRHLNALLSSTQRESTMPGLRIDFSSSARGSGRDGLFTSTGIIGMVEAKDMKSVLTMLPFMGALLDRMCGEAECAHLPSFSRCTRTLL